MSTLDKLKREIKKKPKDFTYSEARRLLSKLGFAEINKGKTSGSRVRFYRERDKAIIDLHRPHPQDELKEYAVRQLVERLEEYGDI